MDRLRVPRQLAKETTSKLREKGRGGAEGVVLWRGTMDPPRVTRVIIPRQTSSAGRFQIPLAERQRLTRELAGTGEFIVAQVHSHPAEAFHSRIDDEEAVPRAVGAISLVVPDFAAHRELLDGAACFALSDTGAWQEVPVDVIHITRGEEGLLRWLIDTLKSFGRSGT